MFPSEDSCSVRDNARLMKALKILTYHGHLLSVRHPVALVMQHTRQQVRQYALSVSSNCVVMHDPERKRLERAPHSGPTGI
jgi:hypothetical protein